MGKPTPQESATQRFEKVMERAREHHSAEKEWTRRPKSRIHDATVNALAKSAREMAKFTGDDDCSAKSEPAGMVIKEISARRIFFEEIRGKTVDVAKRTITSAEHQVMVGCSVSLRSQIIQQACFTLATSEPPLMIKFAMCPRAPAPEGDSQPVEWPRVETLCLGLLWETASCKAGAIMADSLAVRTQAGLVTDMVERIVIESPSEATVLKRIADVKEYLGKEFQPFDFSVCDDAREPFTKASLFEQPYMDVSALVVAGDVLTCIREAKPVAGALRKMSRMMLSKIDAVSTRVRNLATARALSNSNVMKIAWDHLVELLASDGNLANADCVGEAAAAAGQFKEKVLSIATGLKEPSGKSEDAYNAVVDVCQEEQQEISMKFCATCIANADPSDFEDTVYAENMDMAKVVNAFMCNTLMSWFSVEELQVEDDTWDELYWVGNVLEYCAHFAPKSQALQSTRKKMILTHHVKSLLMATSTVTEDCATGLRERVKAHLMDSGLKPAADQEVNDILGDSFMTFLHKLNHAWAGVQVATPLMSYVRRVVHSPFCSDAFLSVAKEFESKVPDCVKALLVSARSMKALERSFGWVKDGRQIGRIELTTALMDASTVTNDVRELESFGKHENELIRVWRLALRDLTKPDVEEDIQQFLDKCSGLEEALTKWSFKGELAFLTSDGNDSAWAAMIRRFETFIATTPTSERICEFLVSNVFMLTWADDKEMSVVRSLSEYSANRSSLALKLGSALSGMVLANCINAAPARALQRSLELTAGILPKRLNAKLQDSNQALQDRVAAALARPPDTSGEKSHISVGGTDFSSIAGGSAGPSKSTSAPASDKPTLKKKGSQALQ
ncbi:unnamed protein product [Prorocentrum cordatum]|uniref:Exocyst complex component Sec6 n=1 Tax=Prorocentrum cordatum TaxID=2364126 RepID=A0ABN9WQQ0_9DINO|nr:unnamed protein product [Polarella glacialis]